MKKTALFGILRWIVLAGFIFLLVLFAGRDKISHAQLPDVERAVLDSVTLHNVTEGSDSMIKRLYGLDPADYEAIRLYYPASNMDAEELLLIRLRDVEQQKTVREAIENRLATQKKSFDGYGIEQFALLSDHAEIVTRGNYVMFVVNEKNADAVQAFLRAL